MKSEAPMVKMVSTHREKIRLLNMVSSKNMTDVEPIVEAYIKGRRIHKDYVDGKKEISVMSKQLMN